MGTNRVNCRVAATFITLALMATAASGQVTRIGGIPEELRRLIAADTDLSARVIRAAGIRLD